MSFFILLVLFFFEECGLDIMNESLCDAFFSEVDVISLLIKLFPWR